MTDAVKMNGSHSCGAHNLKDRNPDRRNYNIGRIVTDLAKFAVDSAVNDSRKGVTGLRKLYKIVQERLKDSPSLRLFNGDKRPENSKLAEDKQTKMEEMQESVAKLKQANRTLAKHFDGADPPKVPNEGIRGSDLLQTEKKRIFIRSRL